MQPIAAKLCVCSLEMFLIQFSLHIGFSQALGHLQQSKEAVGAL